MGTPPATPPPDDKDQGQSTIPGFVFKHGRLVEFKSKHVNPPTAFYIGPDDKLGLAFVCTVSGGHVSIGGRLLSPNGRIVPFQFQFANATAGVWNYYDAPLSEGFILSISASIGGTATNVRRGQCFAQVYFTGAAGGAFMNGYLDDAHSLNWPLVLNDEPLKGMGYMERTIPANPAAGAVYTYTIPHNTSQRIHSLHFQLVTSATVATRVVFITYKDSSGNVLFMAPFKQTQAASQTHNYNAAINAPGGSTADGNYPLAALPDMWMEHDDTVTIEVISIDPGDQLSLIAVNAEQLIVDESF